MNLKKKKLQTRDASSLSAVQESLENEEKKENSQPIIENQVESTKANTKRIIPEYNLRETIFSKYLKSYVFEEGYKSAYCRDEPGLKKRFFICRFREKCPAKTPGNNCREI